MEKTQTKEQKNKRPQKWRRIVLIISILIVLLLVWAGCQAWAFLQSLYDGNVLEQIDHPEEDEPINFLFVGVDQLPGRADTIIVASYNPLTDKLLALSIPRDTYVYVPGHFRDTGLPYGNTRVNAAHSYGGLPLTVETVEGFLGINIHYYARVDYSALHNIVEAIGGVPIDVKFNMNYDDNAGNLHIHLSKGYQVLNGDKAEQFLRWRKNNDGSGDGLGDIGRIQRQQEFLRSSIKQLLQLSNLFNTKELQDIVAKSVDTNVEPSFMLKMFTDVVLGFDFDNNMNLTTVPGDFSSNGSYWLVSGEKRLALDTLIQEHLAPNLENDIIIQVLNATGKNGLASEVVEKLGKYPHINAFAGNADTNDLPVTEVISYTENNIASYIASMVGAEHNIYKGEDANPTADIVIILGNDYGA